MVDPAAIPSPPKRVARRDRPRRQVPSSVWVIAAVTAAFVVSLATVAVTARALGSTDVQDVVSVLDAVSRVLVSLPKPSP